jgi:hypothetical protein
MPLPGSRQADGRISERHIASNVQMSNIAAHARFESFFSEDPKLPSFERGSDGMGCDALSRRFGKKARKYRVYMSEMLRAETGRDGQRMPRRGLEHRA